MSHQDRRNLGTQPTRTYFDGNALIQEHADGGILHSFQLEDIRQVRLAVEMAGQASQVVCRVSDDKDRELAFGSMEFKSPGVWENRVDSFKPLLGELHERLEPHDGQVRFLEGQSTAFLLAMTILGGALAGISAFFLVYMLLVREERSAIFLIAPVILGGWLMRAFWPRGPKSYDPALYRASSDAA